MDFQNKENDPFKADGKCACDGECTYMSYNRIFMLKQVIAC